MAGIPTVPERPKVIEAVVKPDKAPSRSKDAKRIQTAMAEGRGVEEMAAVEPIDPAKIAKSKENYTFKDKDGNPDTTTYNAQRVKEETAVNDITTLLDGTGYNIAVHGDKILNGILKIPDVKKLLDTMQGVPIVVGASAASLNPEVKEALKKIAENPRYLNNLRNSLNGGLDSSIANLGNEIGAKERAFVEADRLAKAKQQELTDLNDPTSGELELKKKKLTAEFNPAVIGAAKTKADTIADLEATNGTTVRELALLTAAQEKDNASLSKIRARLAAAEALKRSGVTTGEDPIVVQGEIDHVEVLMKDRETKEIAPRQTKVDELTNLKAEKADLEKDINETIPNQIEQVTRERATLDEAKFAAQADWESAKNSFEQATSQRVKTFEGMMTEETVKYIKAEIVFAENIEKTRLTAEIAEKVAAGDKVGADLLRSMEGRWDSQFDHNHRVLRWKDPEQRMEPDPGKVQPELDILLTNGPEGLVNALFKDIDYSTTPPTETMRINPDTGRKYSPSDIKEFMTDDGKVKGVSSEAVQRVLGKSMRLGLVNQGNISRILEASWGREAITNARKYNKEADQAMCEFEKKSGMPFDKIFEEAKKNKKLGWWLILMLLMPQVGLIVGAGVAAKNLIGPIGGKGPEQAHPKAALEAA